MTVAAPSDPSGPAGSEPGSRLRGIAGPFEIEDLLLALWVLLVERAFLTLLGLGWQQGMGGVEMAVFRRPGFVPVGASGEAQMWMVVLPGPLTTLGWLIVAGLLFVIVTRGPDDWSLDEWLKRRFLVMPPPLFYLLHIWAGIAYLLSRLRKPSGNATPVARRAPAGAETIVTEPQYYGPLVPRVARRLAVVPAALLGESAFRAQVLELGSDFGSTLTLGTLTVASLRAADGGDLFKLLLSVVLLAGAFAFLVAGPRIAAGATFSWKVWGLRFGLFVASVVMGSRFPAP